MTLDEMDLEIHFVKDNDTLCRDSRSLHEVDLVKIAHRDVTDLLIDVV